MFNGSPAGQVNQVQAYSPALKLAAIAEDYSRQESSSNEDLDCDEDSFNFEDIPPRSCTQLGTNDSMSSLWAIVIL